ncbi:MAG: RDD family protein [Phycisphaerales bacterium]|nr:RDD family protein [Phycisphaerales bacterium]
MIAAAPAIAQESREVGLFAGTQVVWLYERVSDGSLGSQLRLAILPAAADSSAEARLYNATAMRGVIDEAVVAGDALHVFFTDGTHSRLQLPRTGGNGATPSGPQPQTPLPGPASCPIQLLVEARGDALYALVGSAIAREVLSQSLGVETPESKSADGDKALPRRTDASNAAWLVRYSEGRWRPDRPLPVEVAEGSGRLLAALSGERLVVVFGGESEDRAGDWRMGVSGGASAPSWEVRPLDDVRPGDEPLALQADADELRLLAATGETGDRRLVVWRGDANGFSQRIELESPLPTLHFTSGESWAGFAGDHVLALLQGESRELRLARWDGGGALIGEPHPLVVFQQVGQTIVRDALVSWLELALVPLVLLLVLFRRRESVILPAKLAEGQTLAPLSRRCVAFFIDVLVTAPLHVALGLGMIARPFELSRLPGVLDVMRSLRALPVDQFWTFVACGAAFSAYAFVMEAWCGGTVGKRMAGLRVVHVDGLRCRARAALLRNLLRFVDAYFPPGLLLVLMTVNRQRIGDIVARTVVIVQARVEKLDSVASPPESGSRPPGPDAASSGRES